MKHFLIIAIISLPSIVFAQTDHDNPPWLLDCGDLSTQTEMNICSGKNASMADSIMNDYFEKNLRYYEELIDRMKESKKTNYPEEGGFKMTLQALKVSQDAFINYRESLCEFEAAKWSGGSATPLMVNCIYLSATIDRIRRLESEYQFNQDR